MSATYYGVKKGKDGDAIYTNWTNANRAMHKQKGSKVRKFSDLDECRAFLGHPEMEVKEEEPPKKKHRPTHIYTDGGCLNNGTEDARAGIGVYFGADSDQNLALRLPGPKQSNQRAELMAAWLGVMGCDPYRPGQPLPEPQIIHTDSKYTIKCVTDWMPAWLELDEASRAMKDNWDLIHCLYVALQDRPHVSLEYIKAHAGLPGNEEADDLATQGLHSRIYPTVRNTVRNKPDKEQDDNNY